MLFTVFGLFKVYRRLENMDSIEYNDIAVFRGLYLSDCNMLIAYSISYLNIKFIQVKLTLLGPKNNFIILKTQYLALRLSDFL